MTALIAPGRPGLSPPRSCSRPGGSRAAEALRIGLVNRVVPVARPARRGHEPGHDITQNAPLTVAAAKAAIREAAQPPDRRDLARVDEMVEACFRSDDYREGQRAFAEKRPPAFTGR